MITAILLSLLFADPNTMTVQDFASHWLEPVAWTEQVRYVKAINDPNMILEITHGKIRHRLDMSDFCRLSRVWPGEPNLLPEPNLIETLWAMNDPNAMILLKELEK